MLNGSGATHAAGGRRIVYALATLRTHFCILLLACFLSITFLPAAAHAQLNLGQQMINDFASGKIDAAELTRQMTATGNIGQLDAQNLVGNIVNNPSASLGSLGNVVNGVMNGQMNGQVAQGLALVNDLGDINNLSDMTKVLNNPLVKQGLETALNSAGLGEFSKQLGSVFNTGATQTLVSNLLQSAGLQEQAAQLIAGALGAALTEALGGLDGIIGALTQGLTGATGMAGADAAYTSIQRAQEQQQQNANTSAACGGCKDCCTCHGPISQNHKNIRAHMTNEFEKYRTWLVSTWYIENMAPSLMMMASQMTAAAVYQIEVFGMFLDAKHQLETQRLFQKMSARAHKDYHPSEGMCEFGTASRSLASSERRADLGQVAFAQRQLKRQLGSGEVLSEDGVTSDKSSRLQQFRDEYCDQQDNGKVDDGGLGIPWGGLQSLCLKKIDPERQNKDIDFTRTLDTPLTLDVDFTTAENTDDEKDIFALTNNLYAHDVPDKIIRSKLASSDGEVRPDGYPLYLDLRAITAKRSVAQNSVAAIAAMKSRGDPEVAPFLKSFAQRLGLDETEIHKLIGEEPSYYAQMEVLTKMIYENPTFYADLYDKPVNVERKIAAMEAIGLMQDRDIYKSLLRSEAILAVYLETMLQPEHDRVSGRISAITSTDDNEQLDLDGGGGE